MLLITQNCNRYVSPLSPLRVLTATIWYTDTVFFHSAETVKWVPPEIPIIWAVWQYWSLTGCIWSLCLSLCLPLGWFNWQPLYITCDKFFRIWLHSRYLRTCMYERSNHRDIWDNLPVTFLSSLPVPFPLHDTFIDSCSLNLYLVLAVGPLLQAGCHKAL